MGEIDYEHENNEKWVRSTPQTIEECIVYGLCVILMFVCFAVIVPIALGLGE